jgi:hypothetical protein
VRLANWKAWAEFESRNFAPTQRIKDLTDSGWRIGEG